MNEDWATQEMSGAQLADPRQTRSIVRICACLEEHPEASFTAAVGPGLRQAAHRIFEHKGTSVEGLLAGHVAATAQRCAEFPRVLIAQDTCTFTYKQGQIIGLATLNQSKRTRGLLGHSALAMTTAGTPLGVLHLEFWGGDDDAPPKLADEKLPLEDRESYKWHLGLQAVSRALPHAVEGVLIQDREGDIFPLFVAERPANLHLLVRASHDRSIRYEKLEVEASCAALAGEMRGENPSAPPVHGSKETGEGRTESDPLGTERGKLFAVAASGPVMGTLRVQVPRKPARPNQANQPTREAELEIRVTQVRLQRPRGDAATKELPREVPVWVIHAAENDPDIAPNDRIRWVLISTMPVADASAAREIVGYYARRWMIERLHFTLKSGLGVERLQIDDARSLGHALALYYVVACRQLQLTYLARHEPDRAAAEWLTEDELAVLAAAEKRPVVTIAEAVLAIAKLGGYAWYRTAPPPGVKVLWMGLQRLHGMAEGWRLRGVSELASGTMILD